MLLLMEIVMSPNMDEEAALRQVLDQIRAKQEASALRSVARMLCAELRIPEGRALVRHLACRPHIVDNEEAVCLWLGQQIVEAQKPLSPRDVDTLRSMLVLKLASIQEHLP